jgi:hypothetical protein
MNEIRHSGPCARKSCKQARRDRSVKAKLIAELTAQVSDLQQSKRKNKGSQCEGECPPKKRVKQLERYEKDHPLLTQEVKQLTSEIVDLQSAAKETSREHALKIAQQKTDHQSAVESTSREHAFELAQQKKDHQSALEFSSRAHALELSQQKAEAARVLAQERAATAKAHEVAAQKELAAEMILAEKENAL